MEYYSPPTSKLAFESDKRYHVFLSFSGPDVRQTLFDHLYEALSVAGLNVFLDSKELEKGEIIDMTLERAIESSAIRIPIFSEGYADSVWCLKEAAAMLSTPGLIIPLFYYVDPNHVRYPQNENSPYCQSFLKHYGRPDRYPTKEVDEWKRALHQICSRSGWSMDFTQGFEARLVKTVVNDLIKTLDRVPIEVAKHPVGVNSVKNALIQELQLKSVDNVVKVGIWGIGGIGKTTAAKAVYNQVYADFDAASFLSNVRATASDAKGLCKLQKKILEDISKFDRKVGSVDEGISLLRTRLGGQSVLLILDDVDTVVQLDALVGDWLAPRSRVIITSRNKHILHLAQVQCIHEMSGLEINKGLQLFSWHAFLRAYPSSGYEDLSKGIVKACKGHPLSLEVIGSFLYDKKDDTGCWTEALQNITFHPDFQQRVYNTLKISYDALSDDEKEIFLDIACLFIGEGKTYPIVFWKSLYKLVDTAISNLSMKLLIKIDDEGMFDMHDHLRDMGRNIAETEKEGTRLWEAAHLTTLRKHTNFSRLRLSESSPQSLEKLYSPDLRYLHLQNLSIEDMTKDTPAMLPQCLIWLRLENCTFAIGMNRAAKKPPHSRSSSSIWQLKIMQLDGLSFFSLISLHNIQEQYWDLSRFQSLMKLPGSIGNLSQLQHLNLRSCRGLNKLPDSIGNLSQLQHLNMESCDDLNKLPDSIGNLSQLQHLNLESCHGLNKLPDSIGKLSQLQHLNLEVRCKLYELPDSIGNLSQLQHLNLQLCRELNNLPDSIGNLSQLQHLNLFWCESLKKLPDSIGNLSQLQHLNLQLCEGLNKLPDSIGKLSQVQHLNLEGCCKLYELPDSIGNLSQLQHVNLESCEGLNKLPDSIGKLSQLQYLNLEGCCKLYELSDSIGKLSQLQYLNLEGCCKLYELPDSIGKLSQLHHLNLKGCCKLYELPDSIGNLSQLQHLNLDRCKKLNKLPDSIGNLSQLQHLILKSCEGLNKLPDSIGKLSQLQHLNLEGCCKLYELPDSIGNLSQLQHLNLESCEGLNKLPDSIGKLSQLQHLNLEGCCKLYELPDSIGKLSQLQHLNSEGCSII